MISSSADSLSEPILNPSDNLGSLQSFNIDNSLPPKITYYNVPSLFIRISLLAISSMYFGYLLANLASFPVPVIKAIYGETTAKAQNWAILIGLTPIGGIFGALTTRIVMKAFTRKQFLIFIDLLALTFNILMQISNVWVLLVCRIMQGIICGWTLAMVSIYILELVPKQLSGSFGAFNQLFIVVGYLVTYLVGLILESAGASPQVFFRVMMVEQNFFIIIQLIMFLINYIPQSPNSLINKQKNQEAKRVISLFTIPECVQQAFKQKLKDQKKKQKEEEDQEKEIAPKIKYSPKAYFLGFQLSFMFPFTGTSVIIVEARPIVAGVLPNVAPYVSVIINSVNLIATICSVFILTKFGRRSFIIWGGLALGLLDCAMAVCFVFSDWKPSGYIIFGLLLVFIAVFGMTLGPIVRLYLPEIIPSNQSPFATSMTWLSTSLTLIITPFIAEANNGNPYPAFFIYGGVTLIFFCINYWLTVQTKGRTREEVAQIFLEK